MNINCKDSLGLVHNAIFLGVVDHCLCAGVVDGFADGLDLEVVETERLQSDFDGMLLVLEFVPFSAFQLLGLVFLGLTLLLQLLFFGALF